MGGILELLLLASCMAKSQGLTVDLLAHRIFRSPSSLHYRGGDCTWRIPDLLGGVTVTRPHIELAALDSDVEIICEVNGTVLLQAEIVTHEAVPPPYNVTLDTVDKRLQWEHPFLSQLPPLFELVYEFTITFHVHGKKDGVHMPSLSGPVSNNYFDLASESDYCAEYEFVVEAVTNISHEHARQNSSAVSGVLIGVPSFRNLSAMATYGQQYLHINVTFVLEKEDCPGTHPTFFIVTLEGLGEHRLDINSTHIEDGGGVFQIQLPNTCYWNGTISGGNDAGNGTAYEIQHSRDSQCMMSSRATSTAVVTPNPTLLLEPSDERDGPNDTGLIAGLIAGVIAGIIVVLLFLMPLGIILLFKRKRESIKPDKAEPNEYYSPVNIQSKRPIGSEAYTVEFGQPTAVNQTSVAGPDHKMVQELFPSPQYANTGPPTDTAHECSSSKAQSQNRVTYIDVDLISFKCAPSYDNSTNGYAIVNHQTTQEMAQERKSVSDGQHSAAASQRASPVPTHERSLTISQSQQDRSGLSLANLDGLQAILIPLGSKWYQLGTLLKLSETLLDETQTNIETDSQCIREILTNWLSYHEPSLEKLNNALAEMNEPTLLYDASNGEFTVQDETPPELPPRSSL